MCGIFAYTGNNPQAAELILEGLKSLEYRGYDSWGIAVTKEQNLLIEKAIGKINVKQTSLPASNIGIGHTRWATHGGVTQANAHPHTDTSKQIAIVHNGIVENYLELKKQLPNTKQTSQTDSEIIAHLIADQLKHKPFPEAVRHVFNQLHGLNAVIAIDKDSDQIIAIKNGSPLVVGYGQNANYLSSDAAALLPHTKRVHFLEDQQLAIISTDNITIKNAADGTNISVQPQTLTWEIESAELGTYPNYMIKEIHEQPGIIRKLISQAKQNIPDIANAVKKAYGTYIIGCGSAGYAALSGTYLFSYIAQRHVNFSLASEFNYLTDFLTKRSLVIAISQSGETIDVVEPIKTAKQKGSQTLALTNVEGSTLFRNSDHQLLIGAGPEKCVLATKSFTAQLTHLTLLAYHIADQDNLGQKLLTQAALAVQNLTDETKQTNFKTIAKLLAKKSDIYIIGRGLSYPIALEAALKIKEVSYIHAEGFAAGELKHGVIALIDQGTPCIVFAPDDETYAATISNAIEIKSRGGTIIGISHRPHNSFDHYVHVPDCGPATMIPNTVTAQLLAYHLALILNRDPDKPRNLAKSVTVR